MILRIDRAATLEESSQHCAEQLSAAAARCIGAGGRFTLALSGGSTPQRFYEILSGEPYRSRIDWRRVFLFWGDERCVAPDHRHSNFRLARERLLDRVPVPAENCFPMPGELPPEEGARRYEGNLRRFFGVSAQAAGLPSFDLVLLGLGADGHIASLFPGSPLLEEKRRWVAPAFPPAGTEPAVPRLTLTLPVLNRAERIFFLVSGRAKEKAAVAVLSGGSSCPAALVAPRRECRWFLSGVDDRLFTHIQGRERS